ncbi:UNVERIFIED_CONTAM: hypothetical protein FKN15_013092 [Acipenser sinensis]
MLASRALLVKQVAAVLTKQPVCLAHQSGDWGNWGNTNIAVVFSGCGWWDGTDIHEAAYTMYHLSRNGARFQLFAPNQQQMHVVDHMKGQPASGENRSTFNSDGKDCKINHDVERIMKEFHRSRKPIGLSCMAPILACRVLPSLEVTMGQERDESSRWGRWPYTSMVQAVKSMGARHSIREPYISFTQPGLPTHVTHEVQVDEKNKVISTPTFMWETDYHYHYIFDGIGSMVKHVMRMTASK